MNVSAIDVFNRLALLPMVPVEINKPCDNFGFTRRDNYFDLKLNNCNATTLMVRQD